MTILPLGLTRGLGRARLLSAERVVNLFAEKAPDKAETEAVLRGVSGLASFASTVGNGPIRGAQMMAGVLFVVSGQDFLSLSAAGDVTRIGGIPGSGRVLMANNGEQMIVQRTDETGKAYVCTTSTVTQITDADFPGSVSVVFLDGYFVFARPNSGQAFSGAVYEGEDYDALDYATAESNPDRLVALGTLGAYLVMLGERSTELWYAAGGTAFPFARASGGRLERGCASRFSVANVASALYWLGDDGAVYRLAGASLERISTPAIEAAIAAAGDAAEASATAWEEQGHAFYALSLEDGTFVYDAATGLWHERESYGRRNWKVGIVVNGYGENIAFDLTDNAAFVLDSEAYGEGDEALRRSVTMAPMVNDGARIFFKSLELRAEVGVGLTGGEEAATGSVAFTAQPSDPSTLEIGEESVTIPQQGDRTPAEGARDAITATRWGSDLAEIMQRPEAIGDGRSIVCFLRYDALNTYTPVAVVLEVVDGAAVATEYAGTQFTATGGFNHARSALSPNKTLCALSFLHVPMAGYTMRVLLFDVATLTWGTAYDSDVSHSSAYGGYAQWLSDSALILSYATSGGDDLNIYALTVAGGAITGRVGPQACLSATGASFAASSLMAFPLAGGLIVHAPTAGGDLLARWVGWSGGAFTMGDQFDATPPGFDTGYSGICGFEEIQGTLCAIYATAANLKIAPVTASAAGMVYGSAANFPNALFAAGKCNWFTAGANLFMLRTNGSSIRYVNEFTLESGVPTRVLSDYAITAQGGSWPEFYGPGGEAEGGFFLLTHATSGGGYAALVEIDPYIPVAAMVEALAQDVNAAAMGVTATADGATLLLTASEPGVSGNAITLAKTGDGGGAMALSGASLEGGADSTQGSDPQVALQWSDDGGATWSNELWRSLGRLGERKKRVRWERLGSGRRCSFRISCSEPVALTLFGVVLDARAG